MTFLTVRKVGGQRREHADAPHLLPLLRAEASGHGRAAPPSKVMNSRVS